MSHLHTIMYFVSFLQLSPALRNRLTEIWSENCTDREDLIAIIEHNVKEGLCLGNQEDCKSGIGKAMINFIEWLQSQDKRKKYTIIAAF